MSYVYIENSFFFQSSQGDFDWSSTEQGQILGALFYGNIISQIPAGILAELIGGKMIFGLGIFASSIMTLLTPTLAHHSFFSLIVCRTLIGFAQVKNFILIRVFRFFDLILFNRTQIICPKLFFDYDKNKM